MHVQLAHLIQNVKHISQSNLFVLEQENVLRAQQTQNVKQLIPQNQFVWEQEHALHVHLTRNVRLLLLPSLYAVLDLA